MALRPPPLLTDELAKNTPVAIGSPPRHGGQAAAEGAIATMDRELL